MDNCCICYYDGNLIKTGYCKCVGVFHKTCLDTWYDQSHIISCPYCRINKETKKTNHTSVSYFVIGGSIIDNYSIFMMYILYKIYPVWLGLIVSILFTINCVYHIITEYSARLAGLHPVAVD